MRLDSSDFQWKTSLNLVTIFPQARHTPCQSQAFQRLTYGPWASKSQNRPKKMEVGLTSACGRREECPRDCPKPGGDHAARRNGRRARRSAAAWSRSKVPF